MPTTPESGVKATSSQLKPFDYKQSADQILKALRGDRDRKIIARRFGLGMPKRQTLERIGTEFGITRERVRQIEKGATAKLRSMDTAVIRNANEILTSYLEGMGKIAAAADLAAKLGALTPEDRAYVYFLANLAPDVEFIEENDHLETTVAARNHFDRKQIHDLVSELTTVLSDHGQPATTNDILPKLQQPLPQATVVGLARIAKRIAMLDELIGLDHWPEVNPRSIRDKTYLVLKRHGQPLHFSDIAERIKELSAGKREVTVQAVHNELIKDPRFVLIGRGIYALNEWGYTPGTVADIIVDILRTQQPLHKDEIVRRVLEKRQVKTTTIILNLQEKDQFARVAKATYKLKES